MVNGVNTPTSTSSVTTRLDEEGMLIELYYDRLSYQYTVIYTDGSTGQALIPAKTGTALFGEQVTEYARDLKAMGYALSSESVKLLNVSANEAHNVIEFVYLESISSIKYHIIGLPGCGTLSRSSENVKAATGVPLGSTPIVSNGYLFVGWFTDASCTIPADPAMIDQSTLKLTPVKADGTVWADTVEYFAKFIPKETKFTIMTTGCDPLDADQTFIFRLQGVAGTETEGIDLMLSIAGNGSAVVAALPVGQYTVTAFVDWSWRYDCAQSAQSVTLTVDPSNNRLVFIYSRVHDNWLDSYASSKTNLS
jgi:hypothetical protein